MLLLDASAVLASLHAEPGWEMVESVNLAEVVGKLFDKGMAPQAAMEAVGVLGLQRTSFGEKEAVLAGSLRQQTRAFGLSLGDRACLATASVLSLAVLTADRAWLEGGIDAGFGHSLYSSRRALMPQLGCHCRSGFRGMPCRSLTPYQRPGSLVLTVFPP